MRPRVALITGASRGIGREIALSLISEGFDLMVTSRSEEALNSLLREIQRPGQRVIPFLADMRSEDAVHELANAHKKAFDHLDVLVLSAGMGYADSVSSLTVEHLERQFMVNLKSPVVLIQDLLPMLRRTAQESEFGAKVIAIASLTGAYAEAGLASYGASKSALISLCESLVVEEGVAGVSATAISPGYVDTDMSSWVHDRIDPLEMIRASDVAVLVRALVQLSRRACIPQILVTRPGSTIWRA